jgi:NAD-dependent deacetylase sirtuin 7
MARRTTHGDVEDDEIVLEAKIFELAAILKRSRHVVCYTGAGLAICVLARHRPGLSTACSIPDYRGSDGLLTRLQEKRPVDNMRVDIASCQPSVGHMVLAGELFEPEGISMQGLMRSGIIKHMVSQNCDGLHVRSGIPREHISELHGNTFVEVCLQCEEQKEYIRSFDVTSKSSFRSVSFLSAAEWQEARHGSNMHCLWSPAHRLHRLLWRERFG